MYWLPPWGTDPDTFGAWGQWAGAIASSLAVVVALGLALAEGRRRRRELADRQAAQARTITATLEPAETFFNGDLIELSVQNHGQLPITSPAREAVRGPWADTDGRSPRPTTAACQSIAATKRTFADSPVASIRLTMLVVKNISPLATN